MACMIRSDDDEFDWEGDLPLNFPQRDLIIYEMHFRGYTMHESSKTEHPGTYLGVAEKLDHLKKLGVNCVEPANPQLKTKNNDNNNRNISSIAYLRGDDSSSNYKPMSSKCKCGNFIFNP